MNNIAYLESIGVTDAEAQKSCLEAMDQYDFHWWEPDVDPRTFAYYQACEPTLLSKLSRYRESIELLVGHEVYTHEFGSDALWREARQAWLALNPW